MAYLLWEFNMELAPEVKRWVNQTTGLFDFQPSPLAIFSILPLGDGVENQERCGGLLAQQPPPGPDAHGRLHLSLPTVAQQSYQAGTGWGSPPRQVDQLPRLRHRGGGHLLQVLGFLLAGQDIGDPISIQFKLRPVYFKL